MSSFLRNRIYLAGIQGTVLEQARGRLVLVSAFFVIAYVIVLARAADLTIIQGDLQRVSENQLYEKSVVSDRGNARADMVDRNGVILARSLSTASLFADPALVKEPEKVAKELTKIFPDLSYGSTLQKLQSKKRFVWIKRNITPEDHSKVLYLGHPELGFKQERHRIYPQGSLAAHMVGASGVDGQGLSGLEASFDQLLQERQEPLQLTLDVRLQHVLKREISSAIREYEAKAGAGLVMDVENGEILAAVSLPDYDPHAYKKANANEKFNRVTLGVYELGSTFKAFSTAAFLEKTNGNIAQKFDVREPLAVGRFKIQDYHPEKRVLSLPEVFIHSSNIGSAMIGQVVGTKDIKSFYEDIGLLTTPDFELKEIGRPIIPDPWREVNTLTASYGHGIAVSPLQLTRAMASLVNGGVLITPTIILNKNSRQKDTNNRVLRIVSPQTSHRMRQLMRLVVTQGTGSKAEVEGFLVGGKTGTAEKPGSNGYQEDKLISSFIGAFPMDEPRYVVFVMVDEPKGTKESYGYATGGWVSAPAVARVVSSMASILGMRPKKKNKKFENSLMHYVKTKEQIEKEREVAAH